MDSSMSRRRSDRQASRVACWAYPGGAMTIGQRVVWAVAVVRTARWINGYGALHTSSATQWCAKNGRGLPWWGHWVLQESPCRHIVWSKYSSNLQSSIFQNFLIPCLSPVLPTPLKNEICQTASYSKRLIKTESAINLKVQQGLHGDSSEREKENCAKFVLEFS